MPDDMTQEEASAMFNEGADEGRSEQGPVK